MKIDRLLHFPSKSQLFAISSNDNMVSKSFAISSNNNMVSYGVM